MLIALLGNPFSPAYARAIRAGRRPDPLGYCALNVSVYDRDRSMWALTEQRIDARDRSSSSLQIGRSSMRWDGDRLVVDVREIAPWTRRPITGRVVFTPDFVGAERFELDPNGRHSWCPVAPSGRLDVRLAEPSLRFSTRGYHDTNAGDEPLSTAFRRWSWSRAHVRDRSFVTYDVVLRDGTRRDRALSIAHDGATDELGLVTAPLGRTRWALARSARTAAGFSPRVVTSLEDGPFYARDVVLTRMGGETVRAMHETLSADRLAMRSVEMLLPFRIRRG